MELDDSIYGCDYCSSAISPVTICFSEMTKKDKRWNVNGNIEINYGNNGSTISGDGKYQLVTDIPSDFVCKFEITNATIGENEISPSFVVEDVSFTKQGDLLKIGQGNSNDYYIDFPELPVKCKVDVFNSNAIAYVYDDLTNDFVKVGDWSCNSSFIGVDATGDGSITLKNVKIFTKSKGGVTATGDIELVEGLSNARQSIINQLLTEKGFYPSIDDDYGSEIFEVLGEDLEDSGIEALKVHIQNTLYDNERVKSINRIEPYVTVDKRINIIIEVELVNGTEESFNIELDEVD